MIPSRMNAPATHPCFSLRGLGLAALSLLLTFAMTTPVEAKRSAAPSVPFTSDIDAALAQAAASGRPVVVSFVAAWCPLCRQIKQETFRDPAVVAQADGFLWVQIDIDRNLSTARKYGVAGVPTTAFLGADGTEHARLVGLLDGSELSERLRAISADPLTGADSVDLPHSELIWTPRGYRGSGICFSHVGYGPLKLSSQSPFQTLRLGLRPRTPSTLAKGEFEARVSTTWVNVWGIDEAPGDPSNEFFLDYEMMENAVSLAYGITDKFEIEGEFQNRSRFGGAMDGFVQGFHDVFGLDQNGRDEVPRGDFLVELYPEGQPSVVLDDSDRGSFSRTAQFSFQHNVTCGTSSLPAISYSIDARLETLDVGDFNGGSDWDFGASVALARRFGKFYMYGSLGYAWFGRDDFRGIELEDSQVSILLAGEWRMAAKHSLTLQLLVSEGQIKNFGPYSDTSNEVTIGYKWEVRTKGVLEIGLIENIGSFDNSPDFGIHAGYSQRF